MGKRRVRGRRGTGKKKGKREGKKVRKRRVRRRRGRQKKKWREESEVDEG